LIFHCNSYFVIIAILIVNALLGFFQEYRAEKAIESLKKMAGLQATVIRDGRKKRINSNELVPGDLIAFESGDRIPADVRIIEEYQLEVMESSLTGESHSVRKHSTPLEDTSTLGDMKNMVFGVKRMVGNNALVKRLASVETLGCTTVICTDKTGTLTRNEMTVTTLFVNDTMIDITGTGYATSGDFLSSGQKVAPDRAELLLRIGALNNDAVLLRQTGGSHPGLCGCLPLHINRWDPVMISTNPMKRILFLWGCRA